MAIDINLFEQGVERENTGCLKWDIRDKLFGSADVIPMWVADMDFAAPECVTDAMIRRAQHGADLYIARAGLFSAHSDHAFRVEDLPHVRHCVRDHKFA